MKTVTFIILFLASAALTYAALQIFYGSVWKPYLLRKKIRKLSEGQKFATKDGVHTALYNCQYGKYVIEKLPNEDWSGKCIRYSQITEVF